MSSGSSAATASSQTETLSELIRHMRIFRGRHLASSSQREEMLPDIASVLRVYDAIQRLPTPTNLIQHLEPFDHVAEVERLRCHYRPQADVRILVLGESHVRTTDKNFAKRGPSFLYNERYYTPWWRYLFLPAFAPEVARTDARARLALLRNIQTSGVWVLDASLVALSGYQKMQRGRNNRPLDALRKEIIKLSWRLHVRRLVEGVQRQAKPPVICALGSVLDNLPELNDTIRLNCINRANTKIYKNEDYKFGTQAFVRAVTERNSPQSIGCGGKI